ncbi:anti-sigma factor (TIGR02949 family) [Naumannella cuiyingiana]|uniref:Anti-sigma factor (TIGR02949 family) n=1 Tax=Naumannella cuiyingiana TaxID=1347891 RepID=A0A7Z0D6F3_9ACTN|nr:mycothiol system anti-sigma-R factor [Naumannella cuiyingiana]NYI69743.1 anti-sigma factor (TIGR02949 family) [Naumannella cuiyingiana]
MTREGLGDVDCAEALRRMQEFLDTELDGASVDAIRAHLEACEPCLENFDTEDALKRLVHRCCGASGISAPESLRVRIVSRTVRFRAN